jgi:putative transposase
MSKERPNLEAEGARPNPPRRKRMRRIEHPNHLRFITFSCVGRIPLLGTPALRDLMAECLSEARSKHGFHIIAYVIMPEHAHLLAWPKIPGSLMATGLSLAKQLYSQRVIARWIELQANALNQITNESGQRRVWLPGGGYDRNVFSEAERIEKTAYMHNNPIKRELVTKAVDWPWSSAGWYSGHRDNAKLAMDPCRRPV